VLRIGVVGTARILPSHLRGIRRLLEAGLCDVRITALVGRTMEGALSFRRRGEGPPPRPPVMEGDDPLAAPHMYVSDVHPDTLPECFTDLDAMLARGGVDAVLLLTPVHLHHTQALRCMEAGLHVFVEKPLAVSVRAGWAMVREAERRGLTLGVAEGMRYERVGRLQRWAVDSGWLGGVEMALMGGVGGPWSPDRIAARTPWRHRKLEAGGGPAIDLGVHQFAHLRHVGGEVEEVSAVTARFAAERFDRAPDGTVLQRVAPDVEDTYHALCRFRHGGIGHLAFSWATCGEATWWPGQPVWYGERGMLRGLHFRGADGSGVDLGAEGPARVPQERWEQWFPHGITDSKALQFLDFVRAVGRRGQPEASGAEGLRELACAFAILESAEARSAVRVDDVLAGRADTYQRPIDQAYGLV
jgi:predicted dehydrogenase